MTHSKTFTRSNGDKVKVAVRICDSPNGIEYPVLITTYNRYGDTVSIQCEKGAATPEEILEVKRELWLKIEPK